VEQDRSDRRSDREDVVAKMSVRFALAVAVVAGLAACSGAPAQPAEEATMVGFVLTSPSFEEGGPIPSEHTCDGQDLSPALSWDGAPEGTRSFALIVDDPDARGFIHWVAVNIEGDTSGALRAGVHPDADPLQGRNDFGHTGYGGPCPPSGVHHYRFTLYALSAVLAFGVTPTEPDLQREMAGKILAQTTLTGTYTRQR
jgi:Raf kinase inhibitor-like YbhB/YbcL family protein